MTCARGGAHFTLIAPSRAHQLLDEVREHRGRRVGGKRVSGW
jgi:hypothetical protein